MVAKTQKTTKTPKTKKAAPAPEEVPEEVQETTPLEIHEDVQETPVEEVHSTKPAKSSKTTKSAKTAKSTSSKSTKSSSKTAAPPSPPEEKPTKSTKASSKSAKTKNPEPVEKKPSKEEALPKTEKSKRVFKVTEPKDDTSKNGGRYNGTQPAQAAKKAFSQLAKRLHGNDPCEIRFSIQECTQGSDKKVYVYVGQRTKLDTPQVINKAGSEYQVSFVNKVKAIKTKE